MFDFVVKKIIYSKKAGSLPSSLFEFVHCCCRKKVLSTSNVIQYTSTRWHV